MLSIRHLIDPVSVCINTIISLAESEKHICLLVLRSDWSACSRLWPCCWACSRRRAWHLTTPPPPFRAPTSVPLLLQPISVEGTLRVKGAFTTLLVTRFTSSLAHMPNQDIGKLSERNC